MRKQAKSLPLKKVLDNIRTEELEAREKHRQFHVKLHHSLDMLMADWARHNCKIDDKKPKLFTNTSIMELVQWSHKQTIKPDELPE